MDLFFESCVKRKASESVRAPTETQPGRGSTMDLEEAIAFLFKTPMLLAVLDLYVDGRVVAKIRCDSRGAATYKFKTLSGSANVAEVLYRPVRTKLTDRCFFEGPSEIPMCDNTGFALTGVGNDPCRSSNVRVCINVLSRA